MDIYTAAQYMKLGYRIKRQCWVDDYIWGDNDYRLDIDELLATDWEIITEGIVKDFPITYKD